MANLKDMKVSTSLTDRATLSLLSILEDDEPITQRGMAVRIGVALGLTNSLLKRAVRKGLVKISQVPARRFAYYVTPKGFGEKSRLVSEYLSSSLDFFRQARDEYVTVCDELRSTGRTRVVLYGCGELAEIATLSVRDNSVEVLGVVHPGSNLDYFSGLQVISNLDDVQKMEVDAIIITNADAPQEVYELLRARYREDQIFSVPLLHISRRSNNGVFKG